MPALRKSFRPGDRGVIQKSKHQWNNGKRVEIVALDGDGYTARSIEPDQPGTFFVRECDITIGNAFSGAVVYLKDGVPQHAHNRPGLSSKGLAVRLTQHIKSGGALPEPYWAGLTLTNQAHSYHLLGHNNFKKS